ncbi:MAG: twin-arginine translocase subunit TatC [Patescibacteria group bacterium]
MFSKKTPSEGLSPGDDSSLVAEYLPYFEEIKKESTKVLVVFFVAFALGFIYYKKILSLLINLFELDDINLVLTSPYQFIDLSIRTGMAIGIIATTPIAIYFVLKFIKPALQPKEYKMIVKMLPVSVLLFIFGFGFGIWVIQYVINIFSQTSSDFAIGNIWDLSGFLAQILVTGISLGFIFQLPVVLTVALRLQLVKHKDVVAKRRYVYAFLVLFAAILPPTDIISLALLAVIPLFLFEIALLLNK